MAHPSEIDDLCRECGIALLVLFGSRAEGTTHPGADVAFHFLNIHPSRVQDATGRPPVVGVVV